MTAARIPDDVRAHVYERDGGCLGPRVGFPGPCVGGNTIDHVIVAGFSMKCPPLPRLLATLCVGHHKYKTEHARACRPPLLELVGQLEDRWEEGRIVEGHVLSPEFREAMSSSNGGKSWA